MTTLWRSREGKWNELEVPPLEVPLRPGSDTSNPVFAAQLRDFALAALGDKAPAIPSTYGREVVRVMEA